MNAIYKFQSQIGVRGFASPFYDEPVYFYMSKESADDLSENGTITYNNFDDLYKATVLGRLTKDFTAKTNIFNKPYIEVKRQFSIYKITPKNAHKYLPIEDKLVNKYVELTFADAMNKLSVDDFIQLLTDKKD